MQKETLSAVPETNWTKDERAEQLQKVERAKALISEMTKNLPPMVRPMVQSMISSELQSLTDAPEKIDDMIEKAYDLIDFINYGDAEACQDI